MNAIFVANTQCLHEPDASAACGCCVQVIDTDERVAEIHANAEMFDRKAELTFKYLQVWFRAALRL
jgi:hypothetical protein